ncbi:MAG: hypothetical protein FWE67_02890 [Planctomycetaceae bacterium]|nr:hypothetical protein [Planctomycetaceae bacterium]
MDISGTRPYMSPEQWQGKYQDARTYQYALAVMAYKLFSGKFPAVGGSCGSCCGCG